MRVLVFSSTLTRFPRRPPHPQRTQSRTESPRFLLPLRDVEDGVVELGHVGGRLVLAFSVSLTHFSKFFWSFFSASHFAIQPPTRASRFSRQSASETARTWRPLGLFGTSSSVFISSHSPRSHLRQTLPLKRVAIHQSSSKHDSSNSSNRSSVSPSIVFASAASGAKSGWSSLISCAS